jgi:glycosyltransferase involved in cell wall biosynthesis
MHVLYVSDVYFPRINGVSTSIHTFRTDLATLGVMTTLVAPAYPAGKPATDDARILRVRSGAVPRDPEDRRMQRGALRATLASPALRDVELVHIQTPFVAHYAGTYAARRLGVPVIATYHTFFEEYLHHYLPVLPRAWGRAVARTFTRSQCAAVDALVAPSEPMREALLGYGVATPIHVLPTGLPADRTREGNGARFRERHGIEAGRPVLLFVGRVAHEKNIEFLVRMHAQLLRVRPDALLVIAGEGPAREALTQLAQRLGIADNVRFIGYLDRDTELLDCYAAGDLFVFASRTETQGLVLLEAMAQGTPVVSTAELGTRSILTAGSGGVVLPESADAFVGAITALLADPAERQRLAALARAHALSWSSWTMALRLAALYRQLVLR